MDHGGEKFVCYFKGSPRAFALMREKERVTGERKEEKTKYYIRRLVGPCKKKELLITRPKNEEKRRRGGKGTDGSVTSKHNEPQRGKKKVTRRSFRFGRGKDGEVCEKEKLLTQRPPEDEQKTNAFHYSKRGCEKKMTRKKAMIAVSNT